MPVKRERVDCGGFACSKDDYESCFPSDLGNGVRNAPRRIQLDGPSAGPSEAPQQLRHRRPPAVPSQFQAPIETTMAGWGSAMSHPVTLSVPQMPVTGMASPRFTIGTMQRLSSLGPNPPILSQEFVRLLCSLERPHLAKMVDALDEANVRDLLTTILDARSTLGARLLMMQRWAQEQTTTVVDFEPYSKRVWQTLNTGPYTTNDCIMPDTARRDALEKVTGTVSEIETAILPRSSLELKQSALATLRKIGRIIMIAPGMLGQAIRRDLYMNCLMGRAEPLPEAMLTILGTMTGDERVRAGRVADRKGTLLAKVEALWRDADERSLFRHLDKVVKMLAGQGEPSEDAAGLENERPTGRVSCAGCGVDTIYL